MKNSLTFSGEEYNRNHLNESNSRQVTSEPHNCCPKEVYVPNMHLDLVWNIYYGQFELNVKPEFKVVQKMFIISARERGQESVGGLPWWLCNTSVVTNSHEV